MAMAMAMTMAMMGVEFFFLYSTHTSHLNSHTA
jgi:hypothetical protein